MSLEKQTTAGMSIVVNARAVQKATPTLSLRQQRILHSTKVSLLTLAFPIDIVRPVPQRSTLSDSEEVEVVCDESDQKRDCPKERIGYRAT